MIKIKILNLVSIVFVVFVLIALTSCEKIKKLNIRLDELIDGNTIDVGNQDKKVKLTISTGSYNYYGHFRIRLDSFELYDDFDLIPMNTKIVNEVIDKNPYKSQKLSIEIIGNYTGNDSNCFVYSQNIKTEDDSITRAASNKNNFYYKKFENDYKFDMNFDFSYFKSNTIVFFLTKEDIYINSKCDDLEIKKYACTLKDYKNNSYGYMLVDYKTDKSQKDLDIIDHNEHYRIYLSDEAKSHFYDCDLKFNISSNSNIYLDFINLGDQTNKYKIEYEYKYRYKTRIENNKTVKATKWLDSGDSFSEDVDINSYNELGDESIYSLNIKNENYSKELSIDVRVTLI